MSLTVTLNTSLKTGTFATPTQATSTLSIKCVCVGDVDENTETITLATEKDIFTAGLSLSTVTQTGTM